MRTHFIWLPIVLVAVLLSTGGCKDNKKDDEADEGGGTVSTQSAREDVQITRDGIFFQSEKITGMKCKIGAQACRLDDYKRKEACQRPDMACDPGEVERLNAMYFYIEDRFRENGDSRSFLIEDLHRSAEEQYKEWKGGQDPALGPASPPPFIIALEDNIPFRALVEVVYSVARAGYWDLRFHSISRLGKVLPDTEQKVEAKVGRPTKTDQHPLDLTVSIQQKVFNIRVNSARVDFDDMPRPIPRKAVPSGQSAYDYASLYSQIKRIKGLFPGEQSVNITGDQKIPWKVIRGVMNTCRYQRQPGDTSEDFLKTPFAKGKDGEKVPLFPKIVFAISD